MQHCVNCGRAVEPGARFCLNCGKPVTISAPVAAASEPQIVPPEAAPPGNAGKNVTRVAALIVLVGFFLPWVSCQSIVGRQTISGFELASRGLSGLWTVPVSMLIALAVFIAKGKDLRSRASAGKTAILAGAASIVALLYYYAKMNGLGERDEFGLGAAMRQGFAIEVGVLLSFLGSIVTVIGGVLHLRTIGPKGLVGNGG